MKKIVFYAFTLFLAMCTLSAVSFAQTDAKDAASPAVTPAAPATPVAKEEAPKVADMSIYGEVQSVNAQTGSLVVQYYDYDNDEERSAEITLDAASKLDNAKAIADIKKGDWVDITYTITAGKNVARMVSVEKEEPAQDESAPAAY
jgi:hypothetical protein